VLAKARRLEDEALESAADVSDAAEEALDFDDVELRLNEMDSNGLRLTGIMPDFATPYSKQSDKHGAKRIDRWADKPGESDASPDASARMHNDALWSSRDKNVRAIRAKFVKRQFLQYVFARTNYTH